MKRHNYRPMSREQRMAKQAEIAQQRKQEEALSLISRFRDLYELFCDAIFLGQVSSIDKATYYVLDVRNQRYLPEKPTWKERNELFRLAASQRV